MLAANDQEKPFHIGISSCFDINDTAPLHAGLRVVPVLAGHSASLATDTSIDIDDHSPAWGFGPPSKSIGHDAVTRDIPSWRVVRGLSRG